ncbi:MAG: hypothetical protein DI528_21745 [Shinella sp.]|nr:MAG: hypothetical protein DI528_21745 [Shinella sp.]
MIRIFKGGKPKKLEDNSAEWTRIVLSKLAAGVEISSAEKTRYSHKDIKDAIVDETHGKCAYCESDIRHIAYGDIEHVVPKKIEPAKWFEWENLTLACDVCNTNKGSEVDIVDPYNCDPEERFAFLGASIWGIPGDEEAVLTERTLELNRDELVSKRTERIEHLMKLVNVIQGTKNPKLKALFRDDFENEIRDEAEYAALSRMLHRELKRRGVL